MMFVQYPSLSNEERYAYMSPLDLNSCCQFPNKTSINQYQFESFVLEQKTGGLQLKLNTENETYSFDATSGVLQADSTPKARLAYANQIAIKLGAGPARSIGKVELNQWSVIPSVAKYKPFEIFELNDSEESHLYFSQANGELVQHVTLNERTWGWVGSVIHWLYPTIIRSNTKLWVNLVIWLSIVSLFMVLVGAVLGFVRLRHKGRWRKSPYRGRFLWHHYTSLFTGVLMLTWLFSGLMSMYPWGLMEGRSFSNEKQNLRGREFELTEKLNTVFESLHSLKLPKETVEIKGVLIAGYFNLTATDVFGQTKLVQRIAIDEQVVNEFPSVSQLATRMRPKVDVLSIDLLNNGDTYYYNHHAKRVFPVYRIIYEDGERIYLDGLTMDISAVFDSGRKTARWLYLGLHRGDFFPSLNAGLLWYASWGGLLLLMTFAVGIGCWLSIRVWQRLLVR